MSKGGQSTGHTGIKESFSVPGAYPDSDNDRAAETDFPRSLRPAIESCLIGSGRHLKELYYGYKPEQVLDAVASLFPEELQLQILNDVVENCHPSVYLRNKQDLDDIVAKELLSKCRGFTKEALKPILEEAIFTTSVVRLEFVFEETAEGNGTFDAQIPADLREACGRMKHLERRMDVAIDFLGDQLFKPGFLVEGIGAMESLKSQLPKVEDFTLHIRMLTNLPTAAEATKGLWLDKQCPPSDGKDEMVSKKTVGQVVREAIGAAEILGPGEKTYFVFSITRPYDLILAPPAPSYRKWKVQSRRIDVTGLGDVSRLVPYALTTAEEIQVTGDDRRAFELACIQRGDGT
jgi:hypothetical protein